MIVPNLSLYGRHSHYIHIDAHLSQLIHCVPEIDFEVSDDRIEASVLLNAFIALNAVSKDSRMRL